MNRRPLIATSVFTLLAMAGSGFVWSAPGLLGSVVAGSMICLTFASTFWVAERTRTIAPEAVMAVALASYAGKILLLGLVLVLLWNATWLNGTAFALTAIGATMTWLATVVWEASRNRSPIYDDLR